MYSYAKLLEIKNLQPEINCRMQHGILCATIKIMDSQSWMCQTPA